MDNYSSTNELNNYNNVCCPFRQTGNWILVRLYYLPLTDILFQPYRRRCWCGGYTIKGLIEGKHIYTELQRESGDLMNITTLVRLYYPKNNCRSRASRRRVNDCVCNHTYICVGGTYARIAWEKEWNEYPTPLWVRMLSICPPLTWIRGREHPVFVMCAVCVYDSGLLDRWFRIPSD